MSDFRGLVQSVPSRLQASYLHGFLQLHVVQLPRACIVTTAILYTSSHAVACAQQTGQFCCDVLLMVHDSLDVESCNQSNLSSPLREASIRCSKHLADSLPQNCYAYRMQRLLRPPLLDTASTAMALQSKSVCIIGKAWAHSLFPSSPCNYYHYSIVIRFN